MVSWEQGNCLNCSDTSSLPKKDSLHVSIYWFVRAAFVALQLTIRKIKEMTKNQIVCKVKDEGNSLKSVLLLTLLWKPSLICFLCIFS